MKDLNYNELINLAFEECTQSQDSFIKQIIMTYVPTDSKSAYYTAKYPLKLDANSGIDARRKFWSILFKNIFGQENKTLPNHFIRKHVPEGYFRNKDSKVRVATRQEMTELGLHEPATIYLITEIKPEAKVSARAYKGLQRKVTLLEKENRKLRKAVNSKLSKVDPIQYQAKDGLHPLVKRDSDRNTDTWNPAELVKDLMREDAGADSNFSVSDDFINYLLGDAPKPVVEEDDSEDTDHSDSKSEENSDDTSVSDKETEQFLEDLVKGNVLDTPENKKKADDIANHIADQIIDAFPELKSAVEGDDTPVDSIDRGGVILDGAKQGADKVKWSLPENLLSSHHAPVDSIKKHHEPESLSDKFGKQIPAQSDHKSGKCDKRIDDSGSKSGNKAGYADLAVPESVKAEFNKNMKALKNVQKAIDAVNQVGFDNDELTRRIDAIMSDPRTVKANNAVNDILKKYPRLAFSKNKDKIEIPDEINTYLKESNSQLEKAKEFIDQMKILSKNKDVKKALSDPRIDKAGEAVKDALDNADNYLLPSNVLNQDNQTDSKSEQVDKADSKEDQITDLKSNNQRLKDIKDAIQKIFDTNNQSSNGIKRVVINVDPKNTNLQDIIDMLFGDNNEDSDLKSEK